MKSSLKLSFAKVTLKLKSLFCTKNNSILLNIFFFSDIEMSSTEKEKVFKR